MCVNAQAHPTVCLFRISPLSTCPIPAMYGRVKTSIVYVASYRCRTPLEVAKSLTNKTNALVCNQSLLRHSKFDEMRFQ